MKCKLLTRNGTECGADLSPTEECCANCGGNVEIDESKSKKCPRCSKRLSLKDNFCTGCGFSFENETKKTICEGRKEDGTKCNGELSPSNTFCPTCGTRLRRPRKGDGNGKPIFYEPSAKDDEPEKRGLAVVCSHSKFIHKTHKLGPRESASDDHTMMKSLWDLYGCHVIDFTDKRSNFYDTELIDKIHNELEKIENIEIFVFVLSSHGEERVEKCLRTDEQGTFQHYFFTKDGQCSTQDLMNNIANIEKLENKLKIFFIQACRSQTRANDKNDDDGVEFEIELEKGSDLSGGQNDEDEYEEVIQQPNVASGRTEAQGEIENKIENSSSEFRIDLPPIEGLPQCDDCVVMFASMSGKYAYSRSYSEHYSGGWLIKSVDKILKKYEKGDQAHILDILVEINREVGRRESEVERDTCEIPNLEIKMENLQRGLKNHINTLREIFGKHSSKVEINECQDELDKLVAEIDKDGHTEVSLNKIKKETVHLGEKFKHELRCVTLKTQTIFLHNLAFDDKDLFLCKMK